MQNKAIVLYSGPGGVSCGLRQLGIESLGLELSTDAVNTARKNGFEVLQTDIAAISPPTYVGGHSPFLLQASPPCQGLSVAGTKTGRKDIDNIRLALEGHSVDYESQYSHLIVGLKEWLDTDPDTIMLEQVVAIKPVWDWYQEYLESHGYNVWNQIVNMEQYGLAQTRSRSILIASKNKINIPAPVYSKFLGTKPDEFNGLAMQDILPEWAGMDIGFPRKYDGRGSSITIQGIEYRARDLRNTKYPSLTLTEKARSWRKNGELISIDDAKLLQGFPRDYAFTGTRTSQYLQLGNALPPSIVAILLKSTKLVD